MACGVDEMAESLMSVVSRERWALCGNMARGELTCALREEEYSLPDAHIRNLKTESQKKLEQNKLMMKQQCGKKHTG